MYRVLIVDDEKMIRMGMKNAIDWKKLGVDGVFTAASGNEALKILKEEGPEINTNLTRSPFWLREVISSAIWAIFFS